MILVLTRLQNLCLCEGCVEHFVGHSDYWILFTDDVQDIYFIAICVKPLNSKFKSFYLKHFYYYFV